MARNCQKYPQEPRQGNRGWSGVTDSQSRGRGPQPTQVRATETAQQKPREEFDLSKEFIDGLWKATEGLDEDTKVKVVEQMMTLPGF